MPPEGGAPAAGGAPPIGGDMGSAPPIGGDMGSAPPIGGAPAGDMGAGGAPMMENRGLTEEEYNNHINKLVYGKKKNDDDDDESFERDIIQENHKKNKLLNKNAERMVEEIDSLIENSKSLNKSDEKDELHDINIDDIENIEFDE